MTIWFATGNLHKKKELADILACSIPNNTFELKIPSEAGLDFDPDEAGKTFLDNAMIKAALLYRCLEEQSPSHYKHGDPILADDSGLCVDALNGRPGIYSARYSGPPRMEAARVQASYAAGTGKKLDAAEKNALLLAELGDNPFRRARFVCAMVLYYGPDRFYAAQESMEGELVENAESARGSGGFGYDPILFIPELGRTVAELSDAEKNRLSHRGKAGSAICRFLRESVDCQK
ncbi:MAG: non-canonical purine NTP pyrophosphatase [Treponema sp.]|nr:non-canonical purine NTP pyrophosphatase [Treponema sp.]